MERLSDACSLSIHYQKELQHVRLKWNLSSSQLRNQSTLEEALTPVETVRIRNDGTELYYFLRVLELLRKISRAAASRPRI